MVLAIESNFIKKLDFLVTLLLHNDNSGTSDIIYVR